ncbi:hypothetical protein GPECTOR_16g609 [Gonium pectorale]|uniref:Uncharacterized protein n=1 Tax=Gonium pectorale TaxID=33097 RepID=A0A150GL28_GONPE|nr:hypothetical protein GPECTOR_16g609 [Gonium pectorale]|eukprot:KXZ50435.1 hypothetical protein GPECTOR_16g609 [Gonium pectorale]
MEVPPLPPKRKVKAYQVLGDVNEFQERLASTLPPPKAPPPPDVFSVDASEFPPDVWFAATISPDNGVAVIAAYRELCKARALYQQQLNTIHTARKQNGMGVGAGLLGAAAGEVPVNRTLAEAIRGGAETRRLGKFEAQQAKWDEVTVSLATRVGRQPQELAMQRGPAWRTRAELTELLYRAQPRDARGLNYDEVFVGGLRDAWERVIPVGSIFSGLAVTLRERPHEMPACRAARVGRPLDPLGPGGTQLVALTQAHGATGARQNGGGATAGRPPVPRSLSARGRSWEDGEVLRQRVAEYGARLRSLAPHDPDFGALVVAGAALEGQLEELAGAPVTLAEVEAAVREANADAFAAYKAVKDEMEVGGRLGG